MSKTHTIMHQCGFSYVEVIVASFLLAITLVPALEALQPGIQGTGIHQRYSENQYQLTAKMEEILAEPFADLQSVAIATGDPDTSTSYTDTVTLSNGRQITRDVFLSTYDGDNVDADNDPFTGMDADLIWIKVMIEGTPHALENLTIP